MISGDGWVVHHGSCLDVLPTMPENSVDAIVTDPPYELGFMGKKWDSSGVAFDPATWAECLRVLKPGGHLLAFGGSRTWHRIAVAIEDAGFEVRDSIAWLYGSGFPKSLDVSKAIDKGTGENRARQYRFTEWMRSTGITAQEINEATKTQMGSHYLSSASQPAIATADLFDKMRHLLPEVPEEIERLVAERTGIEWTAYKNRKVIGQNPNIERAARSLGGDIGFGAGSLNADVTAPATDAAKQWHGWGTALKPAFEPVIVARKPLVGTVAQNVLEWGTGGLNIDGTRIASNDGFEKAWDRLVRTNISSSAQAFNPNTGTTHTVDLSANRPVGGRWPANVMLDEFTAALLDEQSGERAPGAFPKEATVPSGTHYDGGWGAVSRDERVTLNKGGASRFFYVAKASKRDRNEGLDELEQTTAAEMVEREADSAGMNSPRAGAGRTSGAKNFHPTVKPTDLMRQLVRLVTPPGGTVLDPFTGSGSTGKAAILEGFEFIGVELTDDYLPIIEGRLTHAVTMKREQEAEQVRKENEALF